jgi:hypothetical protein
MKLRNAACILLAIFALACQNDASRRLAAQKRDEQKKQAVFETLNKNWEFHAPAVGSQSQLQIANWSEWRLFITEISQKPTSSIGAFKKKSKAISNRAAALTANMPEKFSGPEFKSRLAAILTKVRMIDMYMQVSDIPADKITPLISEINVELQAFSRQMDEVIRREQIPMEKGESDMIRMLDTARAIQQPQK